MHVPDSGTSWGLLEALSLKRSVPVSLPNDLGVKVRLTVHVWPMPNASPHVFAAIAKLLPEMAMPLIISRAVPLFFNLTVLAAVVWLRGRLPKVNVLGVSVAAGATARRKTVPHPPAHLFDPPPPKVVP
jgi:hypothetical protein